VTAATGRLSICFVAPKNYPLLAERADLEHIGGAEVQRLLVARELARRGFAVSFVTLDYGQPDGIEHDGIRVYKMCRADAGWPAMRFVHPRWTGLWAALARADADFYYQRTAGVESGQVALWCRLRRRALVVAIASDAECDPRLPGKSRRERWFFHYALRRARVVVTQTRAQAERLVKWSGVRATVIRSGTVAPPERPLDGATSAVLPRVLWVGRFATPKRPQWLSELAAACPQWHFDVVGQANQPGNEWTPLLRELRARPNVTLHGYVPHAQIGRFYEQATLLLCTSLWEGYPNTFLEAWSRGLPVVSTVDPDGVIRRHGLGRVATTPDDIRGAIGELVSDSARWRACAERARSYVEQHHSIAAVGDAYERLLRVLAAGTAVVPAPAGRAIVDHQ